MASNLSTIGFTFGDDDSFRAAMVTCAGQAIAGLSCPHGDYRIWRSRAGAELWFHVAPAAAGETEILGLSPFFEGQSEVTLKITGPLQRANDNAFEGAFYGWVAPDETGEGSYPLIFDAVDFAARQAGPWPAVRRTRIAGFARELSAFASDGAYYAANASRTEPQFSAKSFVPIGLFAAAVDNTSAMDSRSAAAPSSNALLTGRIAGHRRFTNEAIGRDFLWLLAESLEATFDIIADPEIVKGEIVQGGTVEVSCLLFGRFLD